MWIDLIMWAVALAALAGTWANVRRQRWCFAVWAVTNVAWVLYDVHLGAWPQAALMVVYTGLAVYGWFAWSKPAQ